MNVKLPETPVEEVKPGAVFSWENAFYIATDKKLSAVNLASGSVVPFEDWHKVQLLPWALMLPFGSS